MAVIPVTWEAEVRINSLKPAQAKVGEIPSENQNQPNKQKTKKMKQAGGVAQVAEQYLGFIPQ
jgi:hypothetical protein